MGERCQALISDAAKALLAADKEEDELRKEQLYLARRQVLVMEKLEAISKLKASLCRGVASSCYGVYQQRS